MPCVVLFLSSKHFLFNVSCEIQIAKYCIVILTFHAYFIFFQFFHIKKCWEVCQLSTYRNYIVLEKDMESQWKLWLFSHFWKPKHSTAVSEQQGVQNLKGVQFSHTTVFPKERKCWRWRDRGYLQNLHYH